MFDDYIRSLTNALADDKNLTTVRMELEDFVMHERFYNEAAGQDEYNGTSLSSPIEVQTSKVLFGVELYNPITIRVDGYHDRAYPNPCSPSQKDPFKLIDAHPVAFSE